LFAFSTGGIGELTGEAEPSHLEPFPPPTPNNDAEATGDEEPPVISYHGKECLADILNLGAAGNLDDLQMDGNFVGRREFESWDQTDMVESS
jgi:hypothetical protein